MLLFRHTKQISKNVADTTFESIITSRILQTEEFSSLLSNIELDFTKTLLLLTTPTKTKVQLENSDNNNIKETPNKKKLAEKAKKPIKITQTVCTKEGENNPFELAGNTKEKKIALISKNKKKTQFIATKLTLLPLTGTVEVAENTNPNNNFITSLSTQINTSVKVSTKHKTESNIQNIPQRESLIRIIDNILKKLQPNNSADIKNRLTKVSSQGIKIDFFYTLPRAAIVIHLQFK